MLVLSKHICSWLELLIITEPASSLMSSTIELLVLSNWCISTITTWKSSGIKGPTPVTKQSSCHFLPVLHIFIVRTFQCCAKRYSFLHWKNTAFTYKCRNLKQNVEMCQENNSFYSPFNRIMIFCLPWWMNF